MAGTRNAAVGVPVGSVGSPGDEQTPYTLDEGRGVTPPGAGASIAPPETAPAPARPSSRVSSIATGNRKGRSAAMRWQRSTRQLPFETEVPSSAIMRGVGDDRHKQGAGLDLPADRDPRRPHPAARSGRTKPRFRRLVVPRKSSAAACILRGVAQKYRVRGLSHRQDHP